MRGETTTIKETKAESTVQKVLKYNTTDVELLQAKVQQPGRTFTLACGDTYEITGVRTDTIHRLIAIGRLVEKEQA